MEPPRGIEPRTCSLRGGRIPPITASTSGGSCKSQTYRRPLQHRSTDFALCLIPRWARRVRVSQRWPTTRHAALPDQQVVNIDADVLSRPVRQARLHGRCRCVLRPGRRSPVQGLHRRRHEPQRRFRLHKVIVPGQAKQTRQPRGRFRANLRSRIACWCIRVRRGHTLLS